MSRPRGDHEERRAVIGLAAADVIATRGLDQLTLRDLAAELGVTTGVLTHYFPSKDALVAYTKELVFDLRFERARQAAEGSVGIERLHAVVAEMLPLDAERRTGWRVLVAFHGSAVGSAAMRRAHDRRMRRWFALFDELIAPRADTGTLASGEQASRMGMAVAFMVEGMAIHLSMMEPAMSAEWQLTFAREQVDRLVGSSSLHGPPPTRRRPTSTRRARQTGSGRHTSAS